MDGVILVDKPAGVTSHDVVARVRREVVGPERSRKGVGRVRVGHAGTLDPFATGLLVVLLGRATRVQAQVMALPKRYEVTARFGFTSTTGDPEGQITETGRLPPEPLVLPTGTLRQRPPGVLRRPRRRQARLRARAQGIAVELPEREVQVHRFERTRAGPLPHRVLRGHLRPHADRRPRATRTAPRCAAPRSARSRSPTPPRTPTAGDLVALEDALARFLPVFDLDGEPARRAAHGLAIARVAPGPVGGTATVLRDRPRARSPSRSRARAASSKPVVGFRS
jgi:tRNA pseudouridine55 synthase